jgi:hypothetical protein
VHAAKHEPGHSNPQHAEAGADQAGKLSTDETLIDDDPGKQWLSRRQGSDQQPQQKRQD